MPRLQLIDRYLARQIAVPLVGSLILAAMLLVLDKMLRLFQYVVEAGGPWDLDANERLRTHILSDGNSIDRAEAYRRFRGRDPDIHALLESRGLV